MMNSIGNFFLIILFIGICLIIISYDRKKLDRILLKYDKSYTTTYNLLKITSIVKVLKKYRENVGNEEKNLLWVSFTCILIIFIIFFFLIILVLFFPDLILD